MHPRWEVIVNHTRLHRTDVIDEQLAAFLLLVNPWSTAAFGADPSAVPASALSLPATSVSEVSPGADDPSWKQPEYA
jgi:hypothetical protein